MTEPSDLLKSSQELDTVLCVRGCTKPDKVTPNEATHGNYCTRCWGRLDTALNIAAELGHHLVGNALTISGTANDRVDRSNDAPVPFNQAAFDDANELYAAVIYWSTAWAETLRVELPAFASGAWKNNQGTIVGLPAYVTANEAADLIGAPSRWLRNRLDQILATSATDDVDAFQETVSDVWRMNARWPRVEKPTYAPTPCPRSDCAKRVAIYPPAFPGDARRIVCDNGHWFPEDEYDSHRDLYLASQKDRMKSIKTANRLAKKYGIGAA